MSHPTDKLADIITRLSPIPGSGPIDAVALLEAHRSAPPTSVRFNPAKAGVLSEDLAFVPWCPEGRYLAERPVFTLDPLFHAGAYYVQEASSMFVAHVFRSLVPLPDRPLKVLDLCAAPGGKSTLLASLLREDDLLIANEVIQMRAAVLAENLSRWGQMNTWVSQNDPKDFARLPGYFDLILADAPCTGSGLWRKDADAIGEWSPEHVKLCSERQKRILADVLPALQPGGLLLYATCSYSAEENEEIADWLCGEHELEALRIPVQSSWNIILTEAAGSGAPGHRFYPWKVAGEGFFLAAFRKPAGIAPPAANHKERRKGQAGSGNSKDETQRWSSFLDVDFNAVERNGAYYAVKAVHRQDLDLLQKTLRIKKTGTALGKLAGKDAIPDHELALSIHLSEAVPRIDLTQDEALRFLKKEEVRKEHTVKGWLAASYQGLALGWGKWLPNRMNNYYPKNWRIRMDIK